MANNKKVNEPKTPDELLKMINGSKTDEVKETIHGTTYDPKIEVVVAPPKVELTVDGFFTRVAQDVFTTTGSKDAADRADAMALLLGDGEPDAEDKKHIFDTAMRGDRYKCQPVSLIERIKTAAACSGIDDECFYLRQHLWLILERDEANLTGAEEERSEDDEKADSPVNSLIATFLGKSALGRVRALAKNAKVSNKSALKAIVFNMLQAQKTL